MSTYTVATYGYECCPSFPTLAEAETHLKAVVAESLRDARRRHKQARKHRLDRNLYRITLGSDPRSTLWSHHCILS
jgi:hypothetical protein